MRDLSQQGGWSRPRTSSRAPIFKAVILVVVVLGLLFVVKQKITSGSFIGGGYDGLKDASHGLKPVVVDGSSETSGGINLSSQTASFKLVKSDISASATATRTYGDGTYNLSVNATLPDPHGNSYAVFLIGSDGPVLTGFMSGSGKSWALNFNDKDKFSKLDGIWITEKITKEFKTPETHILEGSF